MIKSFSKYIDKIEESSTKQVVFSTNEVKEVVFSTNNSDIFSQDISVSLLSGKAFGKYKNGDLIPASGKSVKDIILMALSEAVDEADKCSDSNFIFDKNLSIELINNQIKSLSSDPNDFINKKGQLEVPIGFKRLNSFPLDSSSVFQTLSGLQSYAQTNPSAYYGQICSVIENDSAYIIKADGSVKQLGFNASASIDSLVYATGDQEISGLKTFNAGIQIGTQSSTATFFVESGLIGINNESPRGALDVSGSVLFSQRPTVNGTVVLLSGDIDTSNFYTNDNPSGFLSEEQINQKILDENFIRGSIFSAILPTGISSIDINFPIVFNSIPSVYCSIDGDSDIIYQTLIKNKTTSGCSIYFSDNIKEPNFNLNITASISAN
jgi:hypothetical protein